MKILFLILVGFSLLFSSEFTDKAYSAYKKGHFKQALALYKRAAFSGSLESRAKAEYNLGIFYLRGLGVKKDKRKAISHFRKSALIGQGIAPTLDRIHYSKQAIRVQRDTHNYLARLESSRAKRAEHKRVAKILDNALKQHSKSRVSAEDRAFLRKCPAARVVAVADRKGLNLLPCSFYKRYPKRAKLYFHQRKIFKTQMQGAVDTYRLKSYKRMVWALSPLLRSKLRKEILCIKRASTYKALSQCDRDYLSLLDSLLFTNYFQRIGDSLMFSTQEQKDAYRAKQSKAVTNDDREREIKRVKKMLATKNYLP
jgi:hypothetical protein